MKPRAHLWIALALIATLATPAPCFADNLGSIGEALAVLTIVVIVVFGSMICFIILGWSMKIEAGADNIKQARGLVFAARVGTSLWYLLSVTPVIHNLIFAKPFGHDLGWIALATFLGGLPAHIASIFVLIRARSLAHRLRKEGTE